jgi:DNA-binding IclR family transcriptional regulator
VEPRPHGLGAQLAALQRAKPRSRRRARRQVGIRSVEAGIGVLKVLIDAGRPMKLKDIAALTRMSPSKVHRYMVSYCRTGLLAQDERESTYRLGPYALEMAIACFNALRPVKLGSDALEAIVREIGLSVALAVWGSRGPTIVRIEESSQAVSMNVRAGTVAPVTRSASGLLFAAFLPAHMVEPLIEAELQALPASKRGAVRKSVRMSLDETRRTGIAVVSQLLVPGADAMAAPVFDRDGRICLALLAVGSTGTFSLAADGPVAKVLHRHADALSRALGFRAPRASLVSEHIPQEESE